MFPSNPDNRTMGFADTAKRTPLPCETRICVPHGHVQGRPCISTSGLEIFEMKCSETEFLLITLQYVAVSRIAPIQQRNSSFRTRKPPVWVVCHPWTPGGLKWLKDGRSPPNRRRCGEILSVCLHHILSPAKQSSDPQEDKDFLTFTNCNPFKISSGSRRDCFLDKPNPFLAGCAAILVGCILHTCWSNQNVFSYSVVRWPYDWPNDPSTKPWSIFCLSCSHMFTEFPMNDVCHHYQETHLK